MYIYKSQQFNHIEHLAYFIYRETTNDYPYSKEEMFRYLYKKFGSNCLKKYHNDITHKRKIVEATKDNLDRYKNKNIKFHFKCESCGKEVLTSWRVVKDHGNQLCKSCRKNLKTNRK